MGRSGKKRAALLGIRIGLVFLAAVALVIFMAYYMLSQNFHNLLSDYSIKLVQSMVGQGVKTVEYELEFGQEEAETLAGAFAPPQAGDELVTFPSSFRGEDWLRLVYVTAETTTASDGRTLQIGDRPDIQDALRGITGVYGPYYNEEDEFVVCYTAPVWEGDKVAGALSVEKDGYRFCRLIENIKFMDTGEAYIINAEGTDIAVSRQEHLEWVTTRYNSRELYEANGDEVTRMILELEEKGLRGETGVGTYMWNDGLVYVIYQPIPSTGWVLLGGLREEEISSMTQSALFASASQGPALTVCLLVLAVLTGLIIFWIISSMKKNAEINQKLEIIANHDPLTGLLNRRFLEEDLAGRWSYPVRVPSQAAVYMLDVDNFKLYNDYYGHPQGDSCLRHVAEVLTRAFEGYEANVMRYGGEEFVSVLFAVTRETALDLGAKICRLVEAEQMSNGRGGVVTVSVGVCYVDTTLETSLDACIKAADKALYQAKKSGKNQAVLLDTTQDAPPPACADASL